MAKKKGGGKSSSSSGRSSAGGSGKQQPTRPLSPKPQKAPPPASSDFRRSLESKSAGPLAALHRMPRWLIPVMMAVLMLLGLFIEAAWAGIFFVLVAVFLGWLLLLSWPVITQGSRLFRLLVIAVVGGVGIMRIFGIG